MSVLFYRRPCYINPPAGPLNQSDCQKYADRAKKCKSAIPPELSFDRIINNETLPPCTLQDFMDYLVYVAHDAETLQFYLWLRDYQKRYAALRREEQALSPEWRQTLPLPESRPRPKRFRVNSIISLDGLDFEKSDSEKASVSHAVPRMETFLEEPESTPTGDPVSDYEAFISRSGRPQKSTAEVADEANTLAGLKWKAFTCQPFREEISQVIAHYFAPNAPRELNISQKEKTTVLHALQHTTHPSAFQIVGSMVEATLRFQSHPNFVRWSICNGNKPRVFFVRTMGISHIAVGLLIAIILTLSRAPRWWRLLPAPITLIGMVTLIAAYKGLCVILHASGSMRNLRPWEDCHDPALCIARSSSKSFDEEETLAATLSSSPTSCGFARKYVASPSARRPNRSFDTFGSANTCVGEAWVSEYERRGVLRRVFEKSVWVQEQGLRLCQNRIVRQSQIWGLFCTVVLHAFFLAFPRGMLY